MTVGKKITELRKKHGMTQPMLADKMDVSQSTITMWENDRRSVSTEDLSKLSDLFNVSTDYLLGKSNNLKSTVDISDQDKLDVLTYQGKSIPDEDWEIFKAILDRRRNEE